MDNKHRFIGWQQCVYSTCFQMIVSRFGMYILIFNGLHPLYLGLNLMTKKNQSSEKICKLQKCMKFSETSLEMFLKETTYTCIS